MDHRHHESFHSPFFSPSSSFFYPVAPEKPTEYPSHKRNQLRKKEEICSSSSSSSVIVVVVVVVLCLNAAVPSLYLCRLFSFFFNNCLDSLTFRSVHRWWCLGKTGRKMHVHRPNKTHGQFGGALNAN